MTTPHPTNFANEDDFLAYWAEHLHELPDKAERDRIIKRIEARAIQKAQVSFKDYVKLIGPALNPDFIFGRHMEVICDRLQQAFARAWQKSSDAPTAREQISLPPGGSKSETCTRLFPSWCLGVEPRTRILIVGHGIDFAKDEYGEKVRDILWSDEYKKIFPRTTLRPDKQAANRFLTDQGGEVLCTGIGAKVAGRRAHIIIVDDAIVEEEALSKDVRQQLVQGYPSKHRSRLFMQYAGAEIVVGCLTGDTQILMADNTTKNIKDIQPGELLQTFGAGGVCEIRPAVKAWSVGFDDVYLLETKPGFPIRGNANHPFLNDKGEWVRLADLKIGDKIVWRRADLDEIECFQADIDLAWALGYMYGDGWLTYNEGKRPPHPNTGHRARLQRYVTCVAASIYPELDDRICSIIQRETGFRPKLTKFGYWRCDSRKVYDLFQNLGFKGTAKTKRVPQWVFSAPEKIREAFLFGMIDAGGHYIKEGKHGYGISSCNLELLADMKRIAVSLGYTVGKVRCYKRKIKAPHSKEPTESINASIFISSKKTNEHFGFTTVKSLVLLPEKEEVFDMEVEGNHNFIANGLVVHNTRWCKGDLHDYLYEIDKNSASPWRRTIIPALLTEEASALLRRDDDPDDYLAVGTSFWPEFQPTSRLISIRSSFENNMARWNAVYMQNPTGEMGVFLSGQDFRRWEFANAPPYHTKVISLDTAYTEKEYSDFSAMEVWALWNDGGATKTILMDYAKRKLGFTEMITWCEELFRKHNPDWFLIEERSSGLAIIPELRRRGYPVRAWKTRKDKIARMHDAAPIIQSGRVYVPKPPKHLPIIQKSEDFVQEMCAFPDVQHDDLHDAMTQFLLYCKEKGILAPQGWVDANPYTPIEEDDEPETRGPRTYAQAYRGH